jgi:hypothetical protein
MAMSQVVNVCNNIVQLETVTSAHLVRSFLRHIKANIPVSMWEALAEKTSPSTFCDHGSAYRSDEYRSVVTSFEQYLNNYVSVHLKDGYHFSDQLASEVTVVHKEGKEVVRKHINFFSALARKLKPVAGKFENFLEHAGEQATEDQVATNALVLIDYIANVLSICLVALVLSEILHLKQEYANLVAQAGKLAAQFNRIVLPMVERGFHTVKPNFVAENLFQKSEKGLGMAGGVLRQLVYEVNLVDVLFTTMDLIIFPRSIKVHTAGIRCMAVAPPDQYDKMQYILTGSDDTMVRIHSIEGTMVANFTGFNSIVSYCTFVPPYSQQIFATSFDCTARVWDTCTGKMLAKFVGHKDSILNGSVNETGTFALTCSMDETIRLWSMKSYTCLRMYRYHTPGKWVKNVQFSMCGDDSFFSAGLDNRLVQAKAVEPVPKEHARSIAYMKLMQWTSTGGQGKSIFDEGKWEDEPDSAFVINEFKASLDYILEMCASGSEKILAMVSKDHMVSVWNTQPKATMVFQEKNQAPTWASCICISNNGEYIATGSGDNFICIYLSKSGTCVRQLRVHMEGLSKLVFLNGDNVLACGCSSGQVVFVDL